MRRQYVKALLCSALLATATNLYAATPNSFTPAQQTAIEQIVHNYLVQHPEVLVQAAMALQQKQQTQMEQQATKTIPTIAQELFGDPNSPVAGNPNGTITVVEFFDYQCPHCKDMTPLLNNIVQSNKNVRLVFKQLPIFGANSIFAAKAALAAQQQGKYLALHDALMNTRTPLTNDVVLDIAKQVGLNIPQLQKAMKSPVFDQEIKQDDQLASSLKLTGTPGLVIAKVSVDPKTHKVTSVNNPLLIPGAVDEPTLEKAIAQVEH